MASTTNAVEINIPSLPANHEKFLEYLAANPETPMSELVEPFKQYDAEMRKVFAQQPDHTAAKQPNIVPVFAGHEKNVKIRARDLNAESDQERESYIMPLKDDGRKPDGSPAIVQSLKEFRTNFNVFSESSLVDLDWSNVVVAGSAVVTSLLAVPEKHAASKRALRQYYHEELAPASDVDLFLYGLTEEQAVEKIKQIESNVRDALLVETTTVRTKNTVTIVSRHPVRHVQIVLRIYNSISEILTGFDVDCSCAAYDGSQVYASPRALGAYMTQVNTIDLTRRSPSYENRLSKYAHRGFEVYWPNLDRSRVDPTIFERSFGRTAGLARLLILEKLPKSRDRDAYLDQRREERGRPAVNRWRMRKRLIHGNIKNDHEDEVAEWVDEDVSDYHTLTIPYGPQFHARKIEKLLYTKDLLLNSEWNKPKDREVNLHRHPAFFGTAEDVIHDCCGYCPKPATIEEEAAAEEESKVYISGHIDFIKIDPGRQTIGSFNPLKPEDWTDMAYVGNTARLCQAIVDGDLEYVQSWLKQEGNDPNTRDYTGRAPLHLAAANSTPEIVQTLIDHGARLVARLVDGKTALHLAAMRGGVEIVSALLRKSESNEEEEEKKVDARRAARKAAKKGTPGDVQMEDADQAIAASAGAEEDPDVDMVEDTDEDEDMDATTEHSMVKIRSPAPEADDKALANDDDSDEEPDVYEVNVVAWDTAVSPLHLAIVKGHVDVVKLLVQDFGADVLLPIKLFNDHDKSARAAILTLVLALQLPTDKAEEMARTLIQLGASSAQADMDQRTALQFCVADMPDLFDTLVDADTTGVTRAINHLSVSGYQWNARVESPLMIAIAAKDSTTALQLLRSGAKPEIDFAAYMKAYQTRHDPPKDSKQNKKNFQQSVEQPVITAVKCELPQLAQRLVEEHAVDPNTVTTEGQRVLNDNHSWRYTKGRTLLDEVNSKLRHMRKWEFKPHKPEAPTPLKSDSEYLSGFGEGTYALWSAQRQLNSAKKSFTEELKRYEDSLEASRDRTGVAEKQQAIDQMVGEFEKLEASLNDRGAKTFADLHPEIEEPEKRDNYGWHHREPHKPETFKVELKFQLGDLTEETQGRYEKLFQAAWEGDAKTVKHLTLTPWKDANDDDQPPSKVAVMDQHGLSPFSSAVLRGHFDLAAVIMEISQAQYVFPDAPKKERYAMNGGDSDEDDDASEEEVHLYSEIVDDEFTVENIGEVSMQVKSRVKPLDMMQWSCPTSDFTKSAQTQTGQSSTGGFSYFGPRKPHPLAGKRTNTSGIKAPSPLPSPNASAKRIPKPSNLIQLAIYNDDSELLIFLLDLGEDYFKSEALQDEETAKRLFAISHRDFEYALEADHAHLLAEIIKRTGAGIPLNQLVQKFGVEIKGKPKFYQGLSVHGRKRQDWADAGRGYMGHDHVENYRPPVLEAAHDASLELVEWFLSDAPMRCYKEFSEAHKDNKLLKQLALSKAGFEGSVQQFLTTRSQLAIHCCIMSDDTSQATRLLRYLIQAMPDSIDNKSVEGITPLQVAFQLYRADAAKALIEAGADQTCRDKSGRNLVHTLLGTHLNNGNEVTKLKQMLDLIDKRVLPGLFLERCVGSLTPMAAWLGSHSSSDKVDVQVMRFLLEHSGGQELGMINGDGDTPLHLTVKNNIPLLTQVILEHDPILLHRENATGRTPFEMGEDAALARYCDAAPPMPGNYHFTERRAKRYGLNSDWAHAVMDRSPKSFVEDNEVPHKSNRAEVWETLKETRTRLDAEGKAKRRLVTLNEANEVARRLAVMKSGTSRWRHQSDDGEEAGEEEVESGWSDEVQAWLKSSKKSF